MKNFFIYIYQVFNDSWWVFAFILLCAIFLEKGLKERETIYRQLKKQQSFLQDQKLQVLHEQNDLQLQINSQSDADWIELRLMRGLGVVPENQQKIYFYPLQEK